MDRNELDDDKSLYRLIGELSANMKHVLDALKNSNSEVQAMRQETKEKYDKLSERIVKIEKFNVRILTAASLALPILMVLVNVVVDRLIGG